MQDFLSLSWWISVVVVGIAINLASAYLKPRTDALLSRFSSRWERRSTKKKKEWENFIKRLRDDNTAQIFAYFDMLTARIVAVEGLVLSVFCFIIGGWLYTIQILGVGETFSKENPVLSIPVAYNTFFFFWVLLFFTSLFNSLHRSQRISAALREARSPPSSNEKKPSIEYTT